MTSAFDTAGTGPAAPAPASPAAHQVAAVCVRTGTGGAMQVLLVTSRGTGRWIVPKGWPVPGKSDIESALTEAWEEAGVVKAAAGVEPLGQFSYLKRADGGRNAIDEVLNAEAFLVRVKKLARTYPEKGQRRRKWFGLAAAAGLVDEPQLRAMLLRLGPAGH